jgi:hypothetical protein
MRKRLLNGNSALNWLNRVAKKNCDVGSIAVMLERPETTEDCQKSITWEQVSHTWNQAKVRVEGLQWASSFPKLVNKSLTRGTPQRKTTCAGVMVLLVWKNTCSRMSKIWRHLQVATMRAEARKRDWWANEIQNKGKSTSFLQIEVVQRGLVEVKHVLPAKLICMEH